VCEAGRSNPDIDGTYSAAVTNFRFVAKTVLTIKEAVKPIKNIFQQETI
jgi:hypothetical protein